MSDRGACVRRKCFVNAFINEFLFGGVLPYWYQGTVFTPRVQCQTMEQTVYCKCFGFISQLALSVSYERSIQTQVNRFNSFSTSEVI
mmetsp:Transcript_17162/g.27729  ORF Transcript_17162/g.27729 Transcript_17162/m.27729 type:complete len:87 (+) Transcript_17162:1337-1597(+)